MTLYNIKFADGSELQEYGDNENDVREFCARCYSDRVIENVSVYVTPM